AGNDWVAWTPQGYYAASPGGERMMGFAVVERPDHLPVFHPASHFRKQMYRPELIGLVLQKGSVAAAVKASLALAKGAHGKQASVAELLPPKVTELKVETKDGKVTVRVSADAGVKQQPVAALELRLDGRPVKGALMEFPIPLVKGATATWKVPVPPGSHR